MSPCAISNKVIVLHCVHGYADVHLGLFSNKGDICLYIFNINRHILSKNYLLLYN